MIRSRTVDLVANTPVKIEFGSRFLSCDILNPSARDIYVRFEGEPTLDAGTPEDGTTRVLPNLVRTYFTVASSVTILSTGSANGIEVSVEVR